MNPMSLVNGITQMSGNGKNVTKKCKPVIYSREKRKKVLSEYCKIITEQKEYIAQTFQKSFQEYSEKQFDDFNTTQFMEFVHKNIFEYLDPIFESSKTAQYAVLIDMQDIIVECMVDAVKDKSQVNDEQSIYEGFTKALSSKINALTPTKTQEVIQRGGEVTAPTENVNKPTKNVNDKFLKFDEQGNFLGFNERRVDHAKNVVRQLMGKKPLPKESSSPMQQYQQQQYQPQQYPIQQYPQQQYQQLQQPIGLPVAQLVQPDYQVEQSIISPTNTNMLSTDEQKVLGDVVDFFPKNSDKSIVNSQILEIIKKTLNDVITEKREELYQPLVDAIQKKIQVLVHDIGGSNNNIKMSLLLHMLNNNFVVITSVINDLIKFIVDNQKFDEAPIKEKLTSLISAVIPPESNVNNAINANDIDVIIPKGEQNQDTETRGVTPAKGGKRRIQRKTKKNKRKTMRKKRIIRSR
jgi:hypothetical protein